MEIEIVEAYLIKRDAQAQPKGWSLHVYIPEWEMDLRGIWMFKKESGWIIQMPHLTNFDEDEQKKIRFPVISFSDSEKIRKLKEEIKKKAIEYIEEKLKKTNKN